MNYYKYLPSIFFILLFFVFDVLNAQCPMCRATAEKSDYAKGLNTGILYLLLAPVVILGTVLIIWIKNKKDFSVNNND